MFSQLFKKTELPSPDKALPGRDTPITVAPQHTVLHTRTIPPFPENTTSAIFGMGCFWGVERIFWKLDGVYSTQVGYAAGTTPNPTYREVCTGLTGHNEVVRVIYDPSIITFQDLLQAFFEGHNPTQGFRQGNDTGTQYRSGIYVSDPTLLQLAESTRDVYQQQLTAAGHGTITTEILPAPTFYYAENEHQQYLDKNPSGYCGIGGTGVSCPLPLHT